MNDDPAPMIDNPAPMSDWGPTLFGALPGYPTPPRP
jgi:hypothetical protein